MVIRLSVPQIINHFCVKSQYVKHNFVQCQDQCLIMPSISNKLYNNLMTSFSFENEDECRA